MSTEQNNAENRMQASSANENPQGLQIDPVCKMNVKPAQAAASHSHAGRQYYFCSKSCHEKFKNDPDLFLEPSTAEAASSDNNKSEKTEAKNLKTFYLDESAFDFLCPMHPEVRQKTPGSCSICGMALEASLQSDKVSTQEKSQELKELEKRFWPALVFTILLLGLSMPEMLGFSLNIFPASKLGYAQLFLSLPVVLWSAAPIFKKAFDSAKQGHMNMFTLIAFGVSVSFAVSLIFLFLPASYSQEYLGTHHGMLFFESSASIVSLVLLGQILEFKARSKSNKSLENLFAKAPSKAHRLNQANQSEEIPVYEVNKGDLLKVLPGEMLPADGNVISGSSSVDQSLLSGNALPVAKQEGDSVLAGTINGEGSLLIKAESTGRETVFAQIVNLLSQAQRSRSPMQEIADKVSSIFIPAVMLIAALTFLLWFFLDKSNGFAHAIKDSINVLVIACPCALGLATPIAVSVAIDRASRLGLLVKDARALELLASVSDFLIDKTGTLSMGKFELIEFKTANDISKEQALSLAASLEQESTHPLARAICQAAAKQSLKLKSASKSKNSPGKGIEGEVDGQQLLIGNARFLQENGLTEAELDSIEVCQQEKSSGSRIYMSIESSLKAVFILDDRLKPEAKEFVSDLQELGATPRVVSGDGYQSVSSTGKELNIPESHLHYDRLPKDKVDLINELQKQGKTVAMLGDGVNDAAALNAADAGIAMASGSDVALSSAQITLSQNQLSTVTRGIKLARKMTLTMKENLFLAFAYNCLALLIATGIFYPFFGLEISPSISAFAMSCSSISVILNSMRINLAKL